MNLMGMRGSMRICRVHSTTRIPYPSDVSDDEWAFVAPYLTLMTQTRRNGTTTCARSSTRCAGWCAAAHWRMLPNDLPPWEAVYQQTRRWMSAGGFEAIVHDLRLRCACPPAASRSQRAPSLTPHAAIEPGERRTRRLRRGQAAQGVESACGGRYPGPPVGAAGDPGQRDQERAQVAALAEQVQG